MSKQSSERVKFLEELRKRNPKIAAEYEKSVAAEMHGKYPPLKDPRAVSKIRKIRGEMYEAGDQWD